METLLPVPGPLKSYDVSVIPFRFTVQYAETIAFGYQGKVLESVPACRFTGAGYTAVL